MFWTVRHKTKSLQGARLHASVTGKPLQHFRNMCRAAMFPCLVALGLEGGVHWSHSLWAQALTAWQLTLADRMAGRAFMVPVLGRNT